MKTVLKVVLFGGLLVLFVYTLFFLWSKDQEAPVIYTTETPFRTDIIKKTVATGSVVPRKEIEIKPQVSGIVQEIYVEAGDVVKKGDLIAKVKIIPDMVTLNNAENRMNRARIAYENAERDYKRNKNLKDQGVIADVDFQQFELALRNAEEELESAEANLQLIKEGVTKRSGKSTNTLIRSTIDGMVLNVAIKEGNSVIESNTFNDGTSIATVADMNDMIFEGNVDESEVGKIRQGMALILKIGAIESKTYDATLEYISPKGVAVDGAIQFEIRAALAMNDTTEFIRAGYSANADIVLERKDDVLSIHESLLLFEGDSVFVEVETSAQQFKKQQVKVGLSDGINIEVLSGVDENVQIKSGVQMEEMGPGAQ